MRTDYLPDIMNLSKFRLFFCFNLLCPFADAPNACRLLPLRVKTADGSGSSAVASSVGSGVVVCDNFIGGENTPPVSGEYLDVISPSDGTMLGRWGSRGLDVGGSVTTVLKACSSKNCNSPLPECFSPITGGTRSTKRIHWVLEKTLAPT